MPQFAPGSVAARYMDLYRRLIGFRSVSQNGMLRHPDSWRLGNRDPSVPVELGQLSLHCHFRGGFGVMAGNYGRKNGNLWHKESGVAAIEQSASPSTGSLGVILVVEDDPRMQRVLQRMFLAEHYDVITAGDGQTGLDLFRSRHPVAVRTRSDPSANIGARAMPEVQIAFQRYSSDCGQCDCRSCRQGASFLRTRCGRLRHQAVQSARTDGEGAGLQSRRRRKTTTATSFHFADCEVDFKKMTAFRNGQPIQLTSHEFRLLKFFTDHAERVLSREELLNEVWGLQLLSDYQDCLTIKYSNCGRSWSRISC